MLTPSSTFASVAPAADIGQGARAVPLVLAVVAAFALALVAPPPAGAASALRIPRDLVIGDVSAATYDEEGTRVGPASLRVENVADGGVRIEARSGFSGAAQTVVTALLEPTPDGGALRPVWQESRSLDANGDPLGVLRVDHVLGEGICTPADGSAPERVGLPDDDRVANVVVSQLLGPIVAARTGSFDFSILICRPDVRIVSARAAVVKAAASEAAGELVQVETAVELGPILGRLLGPFLPRISIWFDPKATASWMGQRMPLFGKGPTVLVLRSDVSPARVLGR